MALGAAPVSARLAPIIYLPWMTFPVGPQRKSVLLPSIGNTSRNGTEVVALLLEHPAERRFLAELTYFSKRGGFAGCVTSRRASTDRSISISAGYDVEGIDRTRVHLEHVAELPGDWRFRIDATDVGDSGYRRFRTAPKAPACLYRALGGLRIAMKTERARAGAGLPDIDEDCPPRTGLMRTPGVPAREMGTQRRDRL
jgi:hypothetical protein